ncbi:MAG TPA: hypothetical protein VHL57_00460 [Flavobacteriales bacterium]|jgi:hypothetical protein|nr:hypothetical protein [Flavobacteriales bacterium]
MKRTRVSIPIVLIALAMVLLGTSCTKEELVAPSTAPSSAANGNVKSTGDPDPSFTNDGSGTVDPKGGDENDPSGISDDGDDQGDRERGRSKRGR